MLEQNDDVVVVISIFFITSACAVFVAKHKWFLSQVILWLSDYGIIVRGLVTSLL